jgi:hypothetical protein
MSLGHLNKCPMGELEFISGRRGVLGEEILKSTLFCKVHYVLNRDINYFCPLSTFNSPLPSEFLL